MLTPLRLKISNLKISELRRIGIYGGSFDPIHLGHLSLALEILESRQLTEVWFCPTFINPFKIERSAIAPHHRVAMIRAAIRGISALKYCDIELHREGISYTIDTLKLIHDQLAYEKKPFELFLILGEDNAASFFNWHQPDEILKFAEILVGSRSLNPPNTYPWAHHPNQKIVKALLKGLTPTRFIEVSSSEIRDRLQNQQHVEHLLPRPVWLYIKKHCLYFKDK